MSLWIYVKIEEKNEINCRKNYWKNVVFSSDGFKKEEDDKWITPFDLFFFLLVALFLYTYI